MVRRNKVVVHFWIIASAAVLGCKDNWALTFIQIEPKRSLTHHDEKVERFL